MTKEIENLLYERAIPIIVQNDLAAKFSTNRVSKINHLKNDEASKLLKMLNELTPDYLIKGIYTICEGCGIITNIHQCQDNDTLIIKYCNEALDSEDIPELKTKASLAKMKYASLFIISVELGEIFLKRSSQLN